MAAIYMDANATTPVLPQVVEAMRPYWSESFGNASSVHQRGQQARAAVDHAREQVAALLHCRPAEVVFTSGGTESDNLALFGTLSPGDHLIVTAIEHHAVLHAAEALANRGIEVTFLQPTAQGLVEPAAAQAALRPNTRLVSVMLANNETGVIQPVREIAEIAHAAGAVFHTDAIQAAAKLPLDVTVLGCDLLSLSGHKMHAPQGTGVLFVRRNLKLNPLFFGGLHERGHRPGTENVAGIVGLGCAAELAHTWINAPQSSHPTPDSPPENPAALAALRDRLEQVILARIPDAGVNGAVAPRVPNTTNLYFDGVDAEALIIALDLKGLAVSAGSACQSGATEPSHVLVAMGLPEQRARASVRLSLSRMNTASEVDSAIDLVAATVSRLRAVAGAPAVR
ncbi:MAG TPA: cysteine desulfurase family protein [Acidobacteriaceae bacterium]|jgi:cysteine desulfurase|nr:cysteine desulfurase family protein [Acidobacteriaceae bacterium]